MVGHLGLSDAHFGLRDENPTPVFSNHQFRYGILFRKRLCRYTEEG